MQVQSLGQEDPLDKGTATPVLLPGESHWTEEPGGLQSTGLQRVGYYRSDLERMHDLSFKQ